MRAPARTGVVVFGVVARVIVSGLDRVGGAGALFRVMRPLTWLLRHGRLFAALSLLVTLAVAEVGEACHHLSEAGCAAEQGAGSGTHREDRCACTGLHVVPTLAPTAIVGAPIVASADRPRVFPEREVIAPGAHHVVTRGPPQG